jgi:hypothetical protein
VALCLKTLISYVNMRRSLRTLLQYAEDQAEKVKNIEDVMVCFAPSTDVRCVTLIRNVTGIPTEEMWKSLVDAEIAEQAKLAMNMDTDGSCETTPSHRIVPDTGLQLDVNDIREQEETSSNVSDSKRILSSDQGADSLETRNSFDDCHHISKRIRLTNKIIESGISRVDDFASDTMLSKNLESEIHPSSNIGDEDICISSELVIKDLSTQRTTIAGSSSSSSSSSSTARRESTRCGDDEVPSLPSPVLTETQIAFEDSEFASRSMPRQHAPQHQPQTYRPIQNQSPFQTIPFSTYFMSSYSDVRQRQQQEQEARIEAKVNTVACDTVIMTIDPIAESEESAYTEGSSHSDVMGSSICSASVEIDRDILPTADEAQDKHTAVAVAQSAVCVDNEEDTIKEQTSSVPSPLVGCTAQSAGTKNQTQNRNRNSGYKADLQDPLHFAEWPSWIWTRVHSHPLPLPHVIAGASFCSALAHLTRLIYVRSTSLLQIFSSAAYCSGAEELHRTASILPLTLCRLLYPYFYFHLRTFPSSHPPPPHPPYPHSTASGHRGGKIVYWVQQSMRIQDNLAFETALWLSRRVHLPLIAVVSNIPSSYVSPPHLTQESISRLYPSFLTVD